MTWKNKLRSVFNSTGVFLGISSFLYLFFIWYVHFEHLSPFQLAVVGLLLIGINYLLPHSLVNIEHQGTTSILFSIAFYLIFAALFMLSGEESLVFFLMFLIMILLSSHFKMYIVIASVLYIPLEYFYKFGTVDFNLISTFLKFLFLLSGSYLINLKFRLSRTVTGSFQILRNFNAVETLHDISIAISNSSNIDRLLYKIATSLGLFTKLQRTSIILVDKDMTEGTIAASFEGEHLRNLKIDIKRYPEILTALEEKRIVTIENINESKMMQNVADSLDSIGTQSIMVIPISTREEQLGVLFLRGERQNKGFSREEIQFCQTVATTSAQALLNARLSELIRESAEEKQRMIEELENLNRQLAEANRLKSSFVANVSHELRTPLTSIMGYLQLIREQEISTPEGLKYAETIQHNSESLLSLINGLIDITKIEAGTFELFYEKAHFNEIVEYVCDMFAPLFKKENLECDMNLQKYNTQFFFDVNRIEQVMNNLVSNAVKFSPEGKKIQIKTSFDKNYAYFSVRDEGIGISEEDQQLIFDRFVQVDNSRSREHEGAGIGLHLSSEIIERHRGEIYVKSKAGKGSKFEFKIPLITSDDELAELLEKSVS